MIEAAVLLGQEDDVFDRAQTRRGRRRWWGWRRWRRRRWWGRW
jgi:hypothetical protein